LEGKLREKKNYSNDFKLLKNDLLANPEEDMIDFTTGLHR
jgi:hypothetical protein